MAGSPSTAISNTRRSQEGEHSRHPRRRSQSPEALTRGGSGRSAGAAVNHRREDVEQPDNFIPPHSSTSRTHHRHHSPHSHRHRGRSRSKDRSERRGSKVDRSESRQAEDRRRDRSAERSSHHSHRRADPYHSHKRRRSRSPSPSKAASKRHRSNSPAAASRTKHKHRHHHRQSSRSRSPRARSPRRDSIDDTVAARHPQSAYPPSGRHRSRSRDSRYGSDNRTRRRHTQEGSTRRTSEEYYDHLRRSSPGGYHRHRHGRSPPPSRSSQPEGDRDHLGRSEKSDQEYRGRRSPEPEAYASTRRRRSRSRRDRGSQRESHHRHPAASEAERSRTTRDNPRERSLSRDSHHSIREARDRDADMYGRGHYDPRYGGYPPPHHSYGHHSYPPSNYGSHAGSPMHGYPPQHSSYQQPPPPAQSNVGYYQPQPAKHYGASPAYPSARDSLSRPPQRGGPANRGGRGHFANLSWTPGDGTKGGHLVQPGDKDKEKDSSKTQPPPPPPDPEDEDNPFRPPADLRAEDESARKKRKVSESDKGSTAVASNSIATAQNAEKKTEAESAKNKISFSIKGRASAAAAEKAAVPSTPKPMPQISPEIAKKPAVPVSPLVAAVPKSTNYVGNTRVGPPKTASPAVRKEKVRKKRLKVRPELSKDFAQSESVYYRKTGNESVVGSGTYGKVYKAIHVYTGRMVALKKIRMEGERDGFPVTAIREIKLLQSLNHTNVVALQEVMVEKNDCFMVFEYLAHDLTGLLNHPSFSLTAGHKKYLARQLFEGLDYLHRRGVLHRDIKAANILISKTGELKLADFGLARFYQKNSKQDYTNRVITIWYRSPELLLGETQYGPEVDVWSAACVLVEIFTRHAIFPGDGGEINQLDKIYNVLGTPSRSEWPGITELQWYELLRPSQRIPSTFAEKYADRVSPDAFELLQAMFLYDPASRPTAADVLEHPYFVTEEPPAQKIWELEKLEGDWHEFESKALRKGKERSEREARRREREGSSSKEKRGGEVLEGENKRVRVERAEAA